MYRKLVLCFVFLSAWSSNLHAQPFVDVLNVRNRFFSPVNYVDDRQNKLQHNELLASILFPSVGEKRNDLWLFGINYLQTDFSVSGNTFANAHINSVSVLLGYELQWKNKKWRTLIMPVVKRNADIPSNSQHSIQAGSVLMFTYKKKINLKYRFGFYYNREFFGNYFMPLLGIRWKASNRLWIFGDLPNNMNIEYKLSNYFYSGISFSSLVTTFRNATLASPENYVRQGDEHKGDINLRMFVSYNPFDLFVFYIEAGHPLFHLYQQYNSAKEKVNTHSVFRKTEDGMFVTVGMAMRIRTE